MSAKAKSLPVDPYADETGVVISQRLWDDLESDDPSPEAIAWARRQHDFAMSDPGPGITSEELRLRLLARHEDRVARDMG
ncbi:hypothetical protein N0B44_17095 [Roseibacterium beibuensis]|uniref:hypothetical protein n=1 Tax=[Roseibacterium] beibuensis TaxID=1193142 RepID=UPI00217DD2A9|nr:hypothetical protein [Roseibacterium beibuensis]MCS6624635.1 hypothetical protein [Roseibacterium beibuensis]